MDGIIVRLNEAKKNKGLTLRQLAEVSGVSLGTVNKIMSGELKTVKADKLTKLAEALDVTVEWLQDDGEATAQTNFDYLGLVKIACISPEVRVADCDFNAKEIVARVTKAAESGVSVALLPELCLTGYSCGDLFFQKALRDGAMRALETLRRETAHLNILCIVGLPIAGDDGRLYNAAAVVFQGEILGVVPKKNLPNYNEFMEKRHFCEYNGENTTVRIGNRDVPFGIKLLFTNDLHPEVRFSVEICEDVWVADSPSIAHAAAGANAVFNASASNETVTKPEYRKKMIEIQSAKNNVAYVYCSSGMSESTSATVFSAHNLICENGVCLAEAVPFGTGYAETAVDFDYLENERAHLNHGESPDGYTIVHYSQQLGACARIYSPTPFVPQNKWDRENVCKRAMTILAYGLERRLRHINASKLVIGVSGGSDSTLALLVCKEALHLAGRDARDIIAVTMPCFGTSRRTLANSIELSEAVGATLRQIDITAAVTQHLKDIGHDFRPDTVYENAQARERTQVLMDIANACGGLVVGTGDMSEAALGWSTFNGDQMSMYAAIAAVPKTLVKVMLGWYAQNSTGKLKEVLNDIIVTPVSPELLPTDKAGNISQITENVIGPYELHDYFLFMLVRKGFAPRKVLELAKLSFAGKYDEAVLSKWLAFFVRRFFSQQFKRSCTPDSVRLGSVDLSKYGFRIPSDAVCNEWLKSLEN